ncbi:MAG TPA: DUF2207 domain-containing protein, partial [Candidatus Heimdallarchaeota archaeon]|nr:DUF2207 domain-containing protein [Candidatus Heimdallarchaeota archaeon]
MRKAFFALLFVFGVVVCAGASLRITEFAAQIEVLSTGELSINERLDVLFYTPHHGIYREIPVSYRRPTGENITIDFDVTAVLMDDGSVPYTTKRSGRNLVIRIGDPDRTISGAHSYTIRYTVDRALLFNNEDYIQIYWNVTGNDWQIPIDHAVAAVKLPPAVAELEIPTTSYVGYVESTARGLPASRDSEGRYVFEASSLTPGEGLTI